MTFLPLAILALVQGITEFLPISSSGHLILARLAMAEGGLQHTNLTLNQELAFDAAVHIGTLAAMAVYFRTDIAAAIGGILDIAARRQSDRARLALNLLVASIPIGIVGYAAKDPIEILLRDHGLVIPIIAATTFGFGIVLYVADFIGARRQGRQGRMASQSGGTMSVASALFIGMAQILALIPGTSRSGVTISAARLLGLTRSEATRFSLLLSGPAIFGAFILLGRDVAQARDFAFGADALLAMIFAFIVALGAITGLMRWVARASFTPFVIYRLLLGSGLAAIYFLG